jgi:hypothetical protein
MISTCTVQVYSYWFHCPMSSSTQWAKCSPLVYWPDEAVRIRHRTSITHTFGTAAPFSASFPSNQLQRSVVLSLVSTTHSLRGACTDSSTDSSTDSRRGRE